MTSMGIPEVQQELAQALEAGFRQQYGAVRAALFREVALYGTPMFLTADRLQRNLELDAPAVLHAIVAGQVSGATLRLIRSLMICAAILGDRDAVVRWATEGLSRCREISPEWARTEPEWQLVLNEPDQFIRYSRQIKHFTNQL